MYIFFVRKKVIGPSSCNDRLPPTVRTGLPTLLSPIYNIYLVEIFIYIRAFSLFFFLLHSLHTSDVSTAGRVLTYTALPPPTSSSPVSI